MSKKDMKFVESFLKKSMPECTPEKLEKTMTKLKNKPILLRAEKSVVVKKRKQKKKIAQKKSKDYSKVEHSGRKLLQNLKISGKYAYGDYEQLRLLWKQYFNDLIPVVKPLEPGPSFWNMTPQIKNIQEMVLKADLHGCDITVFKSTAKSMVGQSGTIVAETKNVFWIVTKKDKRLIIPKKNNIFQFRHGDLVITIFGDNFCYRASHRLLKRFKKYVPTINGI